MHTPFIIPFFLMNRGCAYRCIYCNQKKSVEAPPSRLDPEAVGRGIAEGLASPRLEPGRPVEAAFYGGTFTNLSLSEQTGLLAAASVYLKEGRLSGLRVSTRPDALSSEQIEFLVNYGVTTIEIGAQSMDDAVLEASGRGHTARQTMDAAARVKRAGITLGIQLLPGLPGEDDDSRGRTLDAVLAIRPRLARVYPLLVISGAPLARWYQRGDYRPMSLEKAVTVCAEMYRRLTDAGVIVMRLGLQEDPALAANILAGPHHPAFGDLVLSHVYYQRLVRALASMPVKDGNLVVMVSPSDLSQAVGHGRRNITKLADRFYPGLKIKADPNLVRGRFRWQGKEF